VRPLPAAAYHYEMALTRADFLRLLPVAVGGASWHVEDGDIAGEGPCKPAWLIRLEVRPGRAFGPVLLPVLGVTLVLEGGSAADNAAFVERFLLGYQRAGG